MAADPYIFCIEEDFKDIKLRSQTRVRSVHTLLHPTFLSGPTYAHTVPTSPTRVADLQNHHTGGPKVSPDSSALSHT